MNEGAARSLATYVDALARRIDAGWRVVGFRQPAFAEIAATALQELPAVGEIDAAKLVAAVLHDDGLRRAGGHASDTVVPLFEGDRFTISAHVWIDEIGQPHGHAWNGAFQIASGNVVHATYDFAEQWRHDARLRIGALYQRELALLVPGDAIAVEAGATIHALCHLERPSVSVVVRAYDEPDQQTIDYWRPGLAIESGVRDPRWAPALRCLRLVQQTDPPRVPALVRELLPRLDARGVVEILRAALDGGTDIEAILTLGQDGPHLLRAHATVLTAALEDMLRHTAFARARGHRHDLDDRFALASLYLAEDRESIGALAAMRWPPAHAEHRLLDVIADLADRNDDVLGLTTHEAASLRGCEPAPSLRRHPMLAPLWAG